MLKTEGHHFLSFAFLTFSLTLTLTLEISSHSIIQYDALVRSLEAGRVGRVVAVGGRGDGASARQEPGAGQLEVAGHLPRPTLQLAMSCFAKFHSTHRTPYQAWRRPCNRSLFHSPVIREGLLTALSNMGWVSSYRWPGDPTTMIIIF